MPAAHRGPGRRVVLQVHGREILAGRPPQPGARQGQLAGTLGYQHIDLLAAELLRRDLDDVGRPVPGPGAAETERSPVRQHRDQVLVAALDERGRPGPVQMPDEDPHRATPATLGSPGDAGLVPAGSPRGEAGLRAPAARASVRRTPPREPPCWRAPGSGRRPRPPRRRARSGRGTGGRGPGRSGPGCPRTARPGRPSTTRRHPVGRPAGGRRPPGRTGSPPACPPRRPGAPPRCSARRPRPRSPAPRPASGRVVRPHRFTTGCGPRVLPLAPAGLGPASLGLGSVDPAR